MFASLDILRMAQAFASHAATRQQAIAENIANADTPGYRARDVVPFSEFWAAQHRPDQAPPPRPTDLVRPDPQQEGMEPNANGVSLEHEMTRAASARQQYDMALGIYATARDILRASIGR